MLTAAGYLLLVVIGATVGLERLGVSGASTRSGDDWARFDRRQFLVERVVDGDTIRISSEHGTEKVRLIGVDAPELNSSDARPPDHWAERATNYLRARCELRQVTLRLEQTQTRDRFGRLLAYVYLSDSDCINQDLIRDGQAYADRRFKHTFRPQFELAENEARKKGRGLWKDVREDQMPAWRQQWLREARLGRQL